MLCQLPAGYVQLSTTICKTKCCGPFCGNVVVSFSQLILFALSSDVDGGMMTTGDSGVLNLINGTSRANILCQKDAESYGLWGRYSALISTKQHNLQNITAEKYRHLPIVNTMVS